MTPACQPPRRPWGPVSDRGLQSSSCCPPSPGLVLTFRLAPVGPTVHPPLCSGPPMVEAGGTFHSGATGAPEGAG